MKIVAIVQARTGSTRLPGKVLMDVAGQSMLAQVLTRLGGCNLIQELLVATTDRPEDDSIVAECKRISVPVSRGDRDDVLDRYFRAAQLVRADVVVRITSDCPLIDPEITGKTIEAYLESAADYASNGLVRTYPRGLDTETMSFQTLERAWRLARKPYEREHVTPYIYEHSEEFKLVSVTGETDYSSHRWTVDTPEDMEFVREIYHRLSGRFSWRDVLDLVQQEPQLLDLNRSIVQKALH
ncbi:MAG TPA: glycosyltransferase family protein [Candidatus Sulfotelmatobacter sp.]|nr:glycosyltransferase family protein [Candidatus Sulfotelmatobacter sp.]